MKIGFTKTGVRVSLNSGERKYLKDEGKFSVIHISKKPNVFRIMADAEGNSCFDMKLNNEHRWRVDFAKLAMNGTKFFGSQKAEIQMSDHEGRRCIIATMPMEPKEPRRVRGRRRKPVPTRMSDVMPDFGVTGNFIPLPSPVETASQELVAYRVPDAVPFSFNELFMLTDQINRMKRMCTEADLSFKINDDGLIKVVVEHTSHD